MENGRYTLSLRQAQLLSELSVGVSVEMGQIELTIDDLLDLVPGNTFEFAFDPLREFPLRLGDEVIGHAVFVLDGDTLALRVVSVAGSPGSSVETGNGTDR